MVLLYFKLCGLNFFNNTVKLINTKFIPKLRSDLRIGPHNEDVISVIIGSVLGDSHLEKRKYGIGTRIIFEQCNRNVEYIM
jgi:ubiquinol-cytochrome c reductase cytochrome b subunit